MFCGLFVFLPPLFILVRPCFRATRRAAFFRLTLPKRPKKTLKPLEIIKGLSFLFSCRKLPPRHKQTPDAPPSSSQLQHNWFSRIPRFQTAHRKQPTCSPRTTPVVSDVTDTVVLRPKEPWPNPDHHYTSTPASNHT